MILDDVSDCAGLIVERAAALHAEILGHRDLHAFDVRPVPKRLEHGVREPKIHHVVHRAFSQIMVYAKDVLFGERVEENLIQLLRRGQIVAEGLFNDDA
jgi:hypothetical protein